MEEKHLSKLKKISLGVISASVILTSALTGFAESENSAVVLPDTSQTKPVYVSAEEAENDIVLISSDVPVSGTQLAVGTVEGINKPDSVFTLKLSDNKSISFAVTDDTCWIDVKTGSKTAAFDTISLSDSVSVYYDEKDASEGEEAKNIADVIFVNLEEDASVPQYIEVSFVEETEKGLNLVSKYGESTIQLAADAELFDYATGEKLEPVAIYSNIRAVVFNAAAGETQKVLLLGDINNENSEVINIISDEERGIHVEDTDYTFGEGEDIIAVNGEIYLPVRILASAAGYNVEWVEETSSVRLTKGNFSVFFTIDNANVGVNKARYVLESEPKIIGVKTYVPVELFEEVLGVNVHLDGFSVDNILLSE